MRHFCPRSKLPERCAYGLFHSNTRGFACLKTSTTSAGLSTLSEDGLLIKETIRICADPLCNFSVVAFRRLGVVVKGNRHWPVCSLLSCVMLTDSTSR